MSTDFDKEFDEAPDATFDDEFESAPALAIPESIPQESFLDKESPLGPSLRETGETALDFSSGAAKGLTMGTMDEIGGALSAGLETGLGALGIGPAAVDAELEAQGFTVPKESFLEKYRGYQQASEKAQKEAAERSPIAETLGQVAGGMTGGSILSSATGIGKAAQGAKSLSDIAKSSGIPQALLEAGKRGGAAWAKSLPLMVPELAATSEEQLIGPNANPMGVAADVAGGLTFGLAGMGLVQGTELAGGLAKAKGAEVSKKIADAFSDEGQPRLRQIKKAYEEYGQKLGIHPRSHGADIKQGVDSFALRDQKASSAVLDTLEQADAKIGQQVGDSLTQATNRGALIDISPDMQAAANRIQQISQTVPNLASTRRSTAAYEKMLAGQAQLNPLELKTLIDDIDSSIGVFKSATNKTPQEAATLSELMNFRSSISQSLKKGVPEYRLAAERFENFRNVLEQLISGDKPAEVTNKFYGNIRDPESKVFSSIDSLIKNVQRDDAAAQPARTAFVNFFNSLQDFEQKEAGRMAQDPKLKQVLPSVDQIRKFILDSSDDSVLRGSVKSTTQGRALVPDVKEWLIGKAPTSAAYMAGKISQAPKAQKVANLSRALFKADDVYLNDLATKLKTVPGVGSMGQALEDALKNGDPIKKNAALFTIMQNPNAKLLINAEDLENENEE